MDATQNAFVKAYEKLNTFDPAHRFFSWIYRITVNQALNQVSRRRPETALDPGLAGDGADPEASCAESEASGCLRRALMHLEPQHRVLVVLKHLGGFSYREIGELLEIPETTVKSRLFTARRQLREVLVEQGYVR
jgi:RNA polymerase sigma-70 factor (ECF subfamily)